MAAKKSSDPPRPSAVIEEGGLRHRSQARGLLNTSNLPALQNLLKRDPEAYTDEFKQQWNHYQSLRAIYSANIGASAGAGAGAGGDAAGGAASARMAKDQEERFRQLLAFVTQLVPSYPQMTRSFPADVSQLLLNHHDDLSPDVRHSAVRSLVLLRNRDVLSSEDLLRTLFPLLSMTSSSTLRSLIQSTILSDVKNANAKTKNHRLNRVLQGLLFTVVDGDIQQQQHHHHHRGAGNSTTTATTTTTTTTLPSSTAPKGNSRALWAVRLAADLWRKNICNDAKTVALLALACFHPHPNVQSSAVRFFLNDLHHADDGGQSADDSDSDHQAEIPDISKLKHQRKVNKKTRSNDRKVRAAAALAKKRKREQEQKAKEGPANFAALYLLNDAQSFAEKLLDNLCRGDKRHPLQVKVRLMQLLSRVMGAHKLCVLTFYSYLVKYLAPHQTHITLILVSLAQSVHEQTPPDVLTPVVRKIADAFVHPGVGAHVVAAGINSVREISRRQPWAMDETLLQDLVSYRKSKDKGVAAASRSLLQLYRDVNPAMLKRKERGKSGSLALQAGKGPRAFGDLDAGTEGIQGLDLLEKHYDDGNDGNDDDDDDDDEDAAWKDWELESDSDGDSDGESQGGWINVDSDGDSEFDVEYSDSDGDGDGNGDTFGAPKKTQTPKERATQRREERRQERAKRRARAASGAVGDDSDEDGESPAAPTSAAVQAEEQRMSHLATTRVLTPADFAKLNELRLAAAESAAATGGRTGAAAKRELAALQARKRAAGAREDELAFLDEADILGPRKKAKADYEERMASIAKGREDREKFGSKRGKKQADKTSSTTNEQKKKAKNFGMVSKSWAVRSKKKASLRDKSKALKKHKEKQAKMKGKH